MSDEQAPPDSTPEAAAPSVKDKSWTPARGAAAAATLLAWLVTGLALVMVLAVLVMVGDVFSHVDVDLPPFTRLGIWLADWSGKLYWLLLLAFLALTVAPVAVMRGRCWRFYLIGTNLLLALAFFLFVSAALPEIKIRQMLSPRRATKTERDAAIARRRAEAAKKAAEAKKAAGAKKP